MIKANIQFSAYLLNSSKSYKSIIITNETWSIYYFLFRKVFNLDEHKEQISDPSNTRFLMIVLPVILSSLTYQEVFGVNSVSNSRCYFDLYIFFSHLHAGDWDINWKQISFYKKKGVVCIQGNFFTVNSYFESENFSYADLISDSSYIRIYEEDFFSGFKFFSHADSIENQFLWDEYVFEITLLTDSHSVCIDENGKHYILMPILHPKIQLYLFSKFKELYSLLQYIDSSLFSNHEKSRYERYLDYVETVVDLLNPDPNSSSFTSPISPISSGSFKPY